MLTVAVGCDRYFTQNTEMDKVAKEIASYANSYRGNRSGSMF